MTNYTTATTINDLEAILALQKANLAQCLTLEEIQGQGFVSVNHSFDQLKKLNDYENHIIAKDNDKIIGYLLAMTQQSKFDIPILFVVGQVCIDKEYRGQGIFDNCYFAYKKYYSDKYDFAITEIASTNLRSLNAHKRIGFKEIHSYFVTEETEWIVVLWDWKNAK